MIVIPARGGSKGIPRKNLVELNNRPLIQYTLRTALEIISARPDIHAIVSTDDEEIKRISNKNGIDVPFIRPKRIAGDGSSSISYVNHALTFFYKEKIHPENLIILQPTSPLRSSEDVLSAIELFDDQPAESLISVYQEDTVTPKIMYTKSGPYGLPLDSQHNIGVRRQDDESVLIRNGAIYITDVSFLKKEKLIVSRKPLLYIMPKYRSINIDTYDDLLLAGKILAKDRS